MNKKMYINGRVRCKFKQAESSVVQTDGRAALNVSFTSGLAAEDSFSLPHHPAAEGRVGLNKLYFSSPTQRFPQLSLIG